MSDPFGGEVTSGPWALNPAPQPRKYTTYERDSDQADEAGHRRYRPRWGRFDQADPADFSYDPSDPQTLNRYVYVQNDPVNFTDPSGLLRTACDGVTVVDPKTGEPTCIPRQDFGGVTVSGHDAEVHPLQQGRGRLGTYLSLLSAVRLELLADPSLVGGGPELTAEPDRLNSFQVAILQNELIKRLTDACTTFIDRVVGASTGEYYDSRGSLIKDFNFIARNGGIFFNEGNGAVAGGQWFGEMTRILIGPRAGLSSPFNARVKSGTLLHEVLHSVARAGDERLSQVLRGLGVVPYVEWSGQPLDYPAGGGNSANGEFSLYFGAALENACGK